MSHNDTNLLVTSIIICIFAISVLSPLMPESAASSDSVWTAPYVDKVVYDVITKEDQAVLALQDGEIDLIGDMVDPSFLQELNEADNIETANNLRNGYGYVTINCADAAYPQNLTAFRRALAFAVDKQTISDDILDGLAYPQDSCVPQVNPFSVEDELTYHYYDANVELGNQMLDDAGFDDVDDDGLREAPDGSDFDVLLECDNTSQIAIETSARVVDGLQALSVNATSEPTDFEELLNRLNSHGDYDMAFLRTNFTDYNVDWLAYEYWSEYADEPYWNFPNFQNATYDSWRDQLLHNTTYEGVKEAAKIMQNVLCYQCPIIVCYEKFDISAYRTDRFEGFVNDTSSGVPSWWTNYKVHLKDSERGPFGGTFTWSNPLDVDGFNFMASSSPYTQNVLMMLYDSLIIRDPQGENVNWLITDYTAETHDDNAEVPEGYTRFTFNMLENATWTDGEPLTADDVAFSLNYYNDSAGNPYGADLTEMTSAEATAPYTVIVEFATESYWHLHRVAYKPIIPKHVFTDIGLDNWDTWNPQPPAEEMVTSGPFNVSEYVAGEFVEISRNPNYFYSHKPDIDSPEDIEYELGTTGHSITWNPSGLGPSSYEILRNGTPVKSGPWNESSEVICTSIDGLMVDTYNYTLVVYDVNGNMASDSVMVSVFPPEFMLINHPPDIQYEIGTGGTVITWNVSNSDPTSYEVLRNGSLTTSGAWDGDNVTIDVGGLGPATYNFTIVVYDSSGKEINDTVFVTVEPSSPPKIDEPPDIEYELDSKGHVISWSPTDLNPASYEIYRNGTLVESDDWEGGDITRCVDGLGVAAYNYTILVSDAIGNTASDTVFVTVTPSGSATTTPSGTMPPGSLPLGTIAIGLAGVGIAAILVVVFFKQRKR